MEIENHKEEVPYEFYLEKYRQIDPAEAASRLDIVYDAQRQVFTIRFFGLEYEVSYPDFDVKPVDEEAGKDSLLLTSLPARTFIMRYLMEGQYVASSGKYITFREYPTYGELYFQPFSGRCLARLKFGFGFKLPVFEAAMQKLPGAVKISMGDVAYEYEVVNGYKMRMILWAGDDEFPPSAQILYSDNFQFGFHAEDLVVAGDLSITTLKILSK